MTVDQPSSSSAISIPSSKADLQEGVSANSDSQPLQVQAVAQLKASTFCHAALILGVTTILLCYVIAVSLGHVPAWLPMISDCAVYPPESYFFRLGMILTAALLFVNCGNMYFFLNAVQYGGPKTSDRWGLIMSGISCLGLGIVAAVNEDENGTVHGASAVVFFFLQMFYMWLVTHRLQACQKIDPSISSYSIAQKYSIASSCTIILILFGLMSTNWGRYSLQIAISEWVGVFLILLFNWSFCYEFKGEFLATLLYPSTSTVATQA
eukprot:TRINITY_DN102_c0_g1_i1.p2 TRINITY_DN102_c0_g1~~TRINITY_DN102_c0_g1_i1.p2  ORF type:complete len:284 (+),score=108.67 TRINITY_DN102_c0_g1_i1:57-854(+)